MTTTKYSNKIKKLPQDLKAPLFRTILNNFLKNFSWGTSAEAYMTYYKFNRCTINLCVRPSTSAFDIGSYYITATSRATSGERRKERNTSGQRGNKFNTSCRDISVVVAEKNSVVKPKC